MRFAYLGWKDNRLCVVNPWLATDAQLEAMAPFIGKPKYPDLGGAMAAARQVGLRRAWPSTRPNSSKPNSALLEMQGFCD